MELIKKIIVILFIFMGLCKTNMNAQNEDFVDYPGLEFLEWNLLKSDVEKLLDRRGQEIEQNVSDDVTMFHNQGMTTFLYYQYNRLNKIKQYRGFHLLENKLAEIFFIEVKKTLIMRYGAPVHKWDDKKTGVIRLIWILDNSQILIYYDYKKKVVDELGAGSYSVDILINQI